MSVSEAATHLSRVTGIDCVALDLSDRVTPGTGSTCSLCERRLAGHAPPTSADPLHRFAAYQAEQIGRGYIYVCAFTLLHIAAAVTREGYATHLLVLGPSVLGSVDETVEDAVGQSPTAGLLTRDAVRSWIDSLPVVSPAEATSLADVAERVALSLSTDPLSREIESESAPERVDLTDYLDYLSSMEGDKRSTMPYPIAEEADLRAAVAAGDRRSAERVLRRFETEVFAPHVEAEEARSRVLELVILLSRAAIEGGASAEQVFGLEYRSLKRLRGLERVSAIRHWFAQMVVRFVDLVFDLREVRNAGLISSALSYVRDHYTDHVTLGMAAEAAGVSSDHLGRVFSREMKMSFSRHVQALRIQEAKRLLIRSSLPVGDVGAAVGFSDHSYFAATFRRETGLSPSEFRASRPAGGARRGPTGT